MINVTNLCKELLRRPSISPNDGGCISYLVELLEPLGFVCHQLDFADTKNLYARKGSSGRNLCFAGHLDVVPPGDAASWQHPPFSAHKDNEFIWGRGAVDMKGALSAFITAASNATTAESISLLLTSDEEGIATNGTIKVVEWLKAHQETIDFCVVGEPTSTDKLGDTIKIGRRGSLNGLLTARGQQGHVAYPHLADNPIPKLLTLLNALSTLKLDSGFDNFQPSNLEITSVDVGNFTTNTIPELASAQLNIRFNPTFKSSTLKNLITQHLNDSGTPYSLEFLPNPSEPFLTPSHSATNLMVKAIQEVTSQTPTLSTSGGTSDARFIHHIAPTIEFGALNDLAHKVNEKISTQHLIQLTTIYQRFIDLYFC